MRPAIAWPVYVLAVAICLTACTIAGYDSETTDEFWPNGKEKSHTVKRRISATNISRDAPAAVSDALDMGADFFTKHATALFGATIPTILLGGSVSAIQRSKAKGERDRLREKHAAELAVIRAQHEKDKADEYATGVLAGKAGGSAT